MKSERVPSKMLAVVLQKRNEGDRYNAIIERAKNNGYHDFKHDSIPWHPEYAECICPKMQLVDDLSAFPELSDVRKDVMEGLYDDSPDQEDDFMTRKMLLDQKADAWVFKFVGQEAPTDEERRKHFEKTELN